LCVQTIGRRYSFILNPCICLSSLCFRIGSVGMEEQSRFRIRIYIVCYGGYLLVPTYPMFKFVLSKSVTKGSCKNSLLPRINFLLFPKNFFSPKQTVNISLSALFPHTAILIVHTADDMVSFSSSFCRYAQYWEKCPEESALWSPRCDSDARYWTGFGRRSSWQQPEIPVTSKS